MRKIAKPITLMWLSVLLLTALMPVAALAATPLRAGQFDPQAQAETAAARAAVVKAAYLPEHFPFYTDEGIWSTESDEDVARAIEAGAFRIRIDTAEMFAWSKTEIEAADFYLEAATIHVAGPLNNEFGLVFRYQDSDNFYVYSISSDGYYRLDRKLEGDWSALISWTENSAINTGEQSFNLIGLLAEGAELSLFVNDTFLTTMTDEAFAAGAIAPSAGAYDEVGVDIAYDDVSVWRIAEENRAPDAERAFTPPPSAVVVSEPVTVAPERIEATRAAAPLFSDRFRRDEGAWLTGAFDNLDVAIRSGGLHLLVTAPQLVGWSSADVSADDFLLEVDASIDTADLPGQVGLFFRKVDDGNYYYFAIEQGSNYGLWKKTDNAWSTLIDWTPSSAILTDGVNRLGVWAEGSTLALFVNDTPLAQVTDDTFSTGVIAVAAGTFEEPDLVAVFDDIELWALAE